MKEKESAGSILKWDRKAPVIKAESLKGLLNEIGAAVLRAWLQDPQETVGSLPQRLARETQGEARV